MISFMAMRYARLLSAVFAVLALAAGCSGTADNTPVEPESIRIIDAPETVFPGDSIHLHAEVLPENASDKSVIWDCGSKYTTIESSGAIRISGSTPPGTVITVSAYSYDRKLSDKADIRVIEGTGLVILHDGEEVAERLVVPEGVGSLSLAAEYNGKAASVSSWSSSDPSVASVSGGTVSILRPGETVIAAVLSDGTSVSFTLAASGYRLSTESVSFYEGESASVSVEAFGSSSLQDISMPSDPLGKLSITGGNGVYRISSDISGSYSITIAGIALSVGVLDKDLSLVSDSLPLSGYLEPGSSAVFRVVRNATGEAVKDGAVFSVSDSSIASISSSGTLTALRPGAAEVSAELGNGEYISRSIEVTGVVLAEDHIRIQRGERKEIPVSIFGDASVDVYSPAGISISYGAGQSSITVEAGAAAKGTYEAVVYRASSSSFDAVLHVDVPVYSISMPESMTFISGTDPDAHIEASVIEETSFGIDLPEISFSCSPDDLIYIDDNGRIRIVSNPDPGIYETCRKDITITARAGYAEASCLLTFIYLGENSVSIKGCTGGVDAVQNLQVGETRKLSATTIFPQYGLAWRTHDSDIVSITEDGLMTGLSTGEGSVGLYYTGLSRVFDVVTIDVAVAGFEILETALPTRILETGSFTLKPYGNGIIPDISRWSIPEHVNVFLSSYSPVPGTSVYKVSADKAGSYTIEIDDTHSIQFSVTGRDVPVLLEGERIGVMNVDDSGGSYRFDASPYISGTDEIAAIRVGDRIRYDINNPEGSVFRVENGVILMDAGGLNATVIDISLVKALLYDYRLADPDSLDETALGDPVGFYENAGAALLAATEMGMDDVFVRMTADQKGSYTPISSSIPLNQAEYVTIDFNGCHFNSNASINSPAEKLIIMDSSDETEGASYTGRLVLYVSSAINPEINGIDFRDGCVIFEPIPALISSFDISLTISDCTFSGPNYFIPVQTKDNVILEDTSFYGISGSLVSSEGGMITVRGGEFTGNDADNLFLCTKTPSGGMPFVHVYGAFSHDNDAPMGDLFTEDMAVHSGVFCSSGGSGSYEGLVYEGGSVPGFSVNGMKRVTVSLPEPCSPSSIEVHYRGTTASAENIKINEKRCNYENYLVDELTFYIDSRYTGVDYIVIDDMKKADPITVYVP